MVYYTVGPFITQYVRIVYAKQIGSMSSSTSFFTSYFSTEPVHARCNKQTSLHNHAPICPHYVLSQEHVLRLLQIDILKSC